MAKIQVWSFYFLSRRAGFANLIPIVSLQDRVPDFLLVQLHNHIWWWGGELTSCRSSGSWVCTCSKVHLCLALLWACPDLLKFPVSDFFFLGENLLLSIITRNVPAPSRAAAKTDPTQMESLEMGLWSVGIWTPANAACAGFLSRFQAYIEESLKTKGGSLIHFWIYAVLYWHFSYLMRQLVLCSQATFVCLWRKLDVLPYIVVWSEFPKFPNSQMQWGTKIMKN